MSETSSMPPEARRRGRVDTLFSAEWFDDQPAAAAGAIEPGEAQPPASRNPVVIVLAVVILMGMLAFFGVFLLGVAGGVAYFYLLG